MSIETSSKVAKLDRIADRILGRIDAGRYSGARKLRRAIARLTRATYAANTARNEELAAICAPIAAADLLALSASGALDRIKALRSAPPPAFDVALVDTVPREDVGLPSAGHWPEVPLYGFVPREEQAS